MIAVLEAVAATTMTVKIMNILMMDTDLIDSNIYPVKKFAKKILIDIDERTAYFTELGRILTQ